MKRKKIIIIIIAMVLSFLLPSNIVEAKEMIDDAFGQNYLGEDVAFIRFYDDYTIEFVYKYSVSNIEIKVCQSNLCDETQPQEIITTAYKNEAPYQTMGVQTFDLNKYLTNNASYVVKASASFKSFEDSTSVLVLSMSEEISIEVEEEDTNDRDREFRKSVERVYRVCNTWVIPGIYMVLAVVLIVKGIFLAIDVVKYSDNSSVRKEKLKAFVYLGLVLLFVAALNTLAGIITGLFE